ncbi:MAG: cobaltochelatase CobN [Variibacter sp.]|nr:cobaltochelatase CobN [Variibacter sp.]
MAIAATVDYPFGIAASADVVSNFDQLFASYLEDERVREFMQTANPAVLHKTADRFAEGIRRVSWTPRSNHAANPIVGLSQNARKEIA